MEERRNKEGEVIKIVFSRQFKRKAKKLEKELLDKAISKLGTSLAKVHVLHGPYKGYFSLNVTKGGRMIYSQRGNHFNLIDYFASHNY